MKMEKPKEGLVILKRRRIGDTRRVEVIRPMISDRDIVQVIREMLTEAGVYSWAMPISSVYSAYDSARKSPRFGDPTIFAVKDGQAIAVWLPSQSDGIFKSELKRVQTEKMSQARSHGVLCFLGDDPKLLAEEITEALGYA
jgi:hypothetical protein